MSALSSEKLAREAFAGAVSRARANSSFLANLLDREADFAASALNRRVLFDPDVPVAKSLRLARRQLALQVAIGDLAGLFDLSEVTKALTAFADDVLDRAIRAAMLERTPEAKPAGFAAIALGKQGSGELNYSSDIDPIFLFDPQILPRRANEEAVDAAVRIGRRVIELLQARDADGSVAMAFQQHAAGAHACLLALPSSKWELSAGCPGANPAALQSGRVADRNWQLLDWQPHGAMAGTLQLHWSDGSKSRLYLELLP